MRRLALDPLQQRPLLEFSGQLKPIGLGAIAGGDRAGAIFVALGADVLGGVAAADDQDVLALELERVAEIMGMQNAAVEGLETLEIRHVGRREMAGGDDDIVELLGHDLVVDAVMRGDGELAGAVVDGRPCAPGVLKRTQLRTPDFSTRPLM